MTLLDFSGVTAMNMLVARIIAEQAKRIKDEAKRKALRARVNTFYVRSHQALRGSSKIAIEWRTAQVTLTTLCQMQRYFWQEFEGICEERLSRSRRAIEDVISRGKREVQVDIFDAQDKKNALKKKIDAIGGSINDLDMLQKGYVTDTVNGTSVYKEVQLIDGTRKGELMEEMLGKGLSARKKYVKRLQDDIRDIFTVSVDLVADELKKEVNANYL